MSKGFTTTYRIALLAITVLALFAGVEARLVWLHVVDRDDLLRSVDEARRQLIVDNARRGDIVDRNGALWRPAARSSCSGSTPSSCAARTGPSCRCSLRCSAFRCPM